MKSKSVTGAILLVIFLLMGINGFAGELKWQDTMEGAFSKAVSENRKVLLFVGRDSCGNCRYMRSQVFESQKPPVNDLLEKHYVLWFSDVDESGEWLRYARGMGRFVLPLICIIDPTDSDTYKDRTTGPQHSPAFYSRLLEHIQK